MKIGIYNNDKSLNKSQNNDFSVEVKSGKCCLIKSDDFSEI